MFYGCFLSWFFNAIKTQPIGFLWPVQQICSWLSIWNLKTIMTNMNKILYLRSQVLSTTALV
jgi:hypothetical protein